MCRYAIPLPLFIMAAVNLWILLQMVAKNVAAIRRYAPVHGEIYQWDEDGEIVVKLLPSGADYSEAERVKMQAGSTFLIGSRDSVTVYVNPSDKAQARLGGFRMWMAAGPLLGMESFVLLAIGYFLATLKRPFGWAYCTAPPWRPNPLDPTARFSKSSLKACFFWGDSDLSLPLALSFYSELTLIKRVNLIDGGLLWFFAFMLNACYTVTYQLSANQEGMSATSLLAWKAVRWDQVKSIEDRTVRAMSKPSGDWYSQISNLRTQDRYTCFVDGHGETLLRIPEDLFGPVAAILQLARTENGASTKSRSTSTSRIFELVGDGLAGFQSGNHRFNLESEVRQGVDLDWTNGSRRDAVVRRSEGVIEGNGAGADAIRRDGGVPGVSE